MKFLFLTDEFYPNFGANSLVVLTVCRQLIQQGHTVFVAPASADPKLPAEEYWENIHILRNMPNDSKKSVIANLEQGRLFQAAGIFCMLLGAKFTGPHTLWPKQKISARTYLDKVITENDIDIIVSINCSIELSFPLLHLREHGKLSTKWFFYMLDPFESHEYYRKHQSVRYLRRLQHRIMKQCDRVLATKLIYEDTALWESADILNKITITEFPKIEEPKYIPSEEDIPLEAGRIHVVCTGSKNETVRNSQYTLALCRANPDVSFHFIGHGWTNGSIIQDGNITFYPPVSHQVIQNVQLKADFLLNIGNAVTNQLPSKVLEYISTGKPIINVYKSEKCPAKELLRSWDSLNLYEGSPLNTSSSLLKTFLCAEHLSFDYDKIEKLYTLYTPSVVVESFCKTYST